MSELNDNFLLRALASAKQAAHIWPEYAACEAALESNWGRSELATNANNLFGRKVSLKRPNKFGELDLPTKEFLHGEWVHVMARWVKYPDWYSCFADRMTLLRDLESLYGDALSAYTGEDFVKLVSAHWSTDPQRAEKVLEIYEAHKGVFAQ